MISSSWGAPSAFSKGFNLQHALDGPYGRHLHVYSWPEGELKQTLDLGSSRLIPLVIRFLHDPSKDTVFVGCAFSTNMVRFIRIQMGRYLSYNGNTVEKRLIDDLYSSNSHLAIHIHDLGWDPGV
ncbi:hypothetical protein AMTRI_Chr06g173020 [Amborella trichopoda]